MPNTFTYVINVAPAKNDNVVQRELVVKVDGEVKSTSVWPGDAVDLGAVSAVENSNIILSLTDVTNVGNRAQPAVVSFVARDKSQEELTAGVTLILAGTTPTIQHT